MSDLDHNDMPAQPADVLAEAVAAIERPSFGKSLACQAASIALRACKDAAIAGNITCRMAILEILNLPWPK